jgi:predicted RNase H-like HicB family nuclease
MKYAVALEPVPDSENMAGYFYAHIPSLGLTTHGLGVAGALVAAKDLVKLWLEEKHHHREEVHLAQEMVLATIEV